MEHFAEFKDKCKARMDYLEFKMEDGAVLGDDMTSDWKKFTWAGWAPAAAAFRRGHPAEGPSRGEGRATPTGRPYIYIAKILQYAKVIYMPEWVPLNPIGNQASPIGPQ